MRNITVFSRLLMRTGIYYRLRASRLYRLYLVANRNWRAIRDLDREKKFYRSILDGFRRGDLIFDVGPNQGDRTEVFFKIGARVVAIDPDATVGTILRQRFLSYRLKPLPVTIVGKAVASRCGTEAMLVSGPGSLVNTLSSKGALDYALADEDLDQVEKTTVETTTLDELVERYGVPALIKIDVVGFELEVLQGLSRAVPCISFEIKLPSFRQELLRCVETLGKLSPQGRFNYTWDRRNGLALKTWVDASRFLSVLEGHREGSLEVVYREKGV